MVMKTCPNCGYTRNTNPNAGLCANCEKERRYEHFKEIWLIELKKKHEVNHYHIDKGIHSKVTITNRDCGHTFTAKLDNVLNGFTKCGVCGPSTRIKNAMTKYVEKYGRNYDLSKWNDYRKEAWVITNLYYKENKHQLNPMGLPRKKAGSHPDAVNVDHIIPMIYCFKNSLPIELATDPLNIRVISAVENLQKKQKFTEEAEVLLIQLRSKYFHATH